MIGGKKFQKKLSKPLRMVGVAIPIFIVSFGSIIHFLTPNTSISEHFLLLGLGVAWLSLALIQLTSSKYPKLVLVLYHILATVSILSMYSIMAPFVSFWILLSLASYVSYQTIGLTLSLIWLVFTLVLNLALSSHLSPLIFAYEFSNLISVLTASYVILILSHSQEEARKDLRNSKNREILQRNRLLSIINNQSDGIISVDNEGKIRVYNAASMWLLDTNKDLIGEKINSVLPLYDLQKDKINTLEALRSYKTNTTRDDILFKDSDGQMLRFEVTFAPIRQTYGAKTHTNDIDGYILIFRDVTKEKSLEDERDEFIGVVSHELRTPITVAEATLSNAELLHSSPKAPKKSVQESLRIAHDQIIFLAGMVNDLSTLSRAQRDIISDPEVISVRELGHQTLMKYQEEAKKKGLTLDLDLGARLGDIYTSKLYIQELLQNLVLNAIKYTQKGSVTISIKRKKDSIRFEIKDTGIGIARNEQKKIFNRFYRSEDFRTRETSGTGLGLYLAAQLADKMGAWLYVESRLNHGSTFYFELPVHKEGKNSKKGVKKNK